MIALAPNNFLPTSCLALSPIQLLIGYLSHPRSYLCSMFKVAWSCHQFLTTFHLQLTTHPGHLTLVVCPGYLLQTHISPVKPDSYINYSTASISLPFIHHLWMPLLLSTIISLLFLLLNRSSSLRTFSLAFSLQLRWPRIWKPRTVLRSQLGRPGGLQTRHCG